MPAATRRFLVRRITRRYAFWLSRSLRYAESASITVAAGSPKQTQERLLGEVLGVVSVWDAMTDIAHQPTLVTVYEGIEATQVAPGEKGFIHPQISAEEEADEEVLVSRKTFDF